MKPKTKKTAKLIQDITTATGISIMVIEHDISLVEEIASRITVMYKGARFREGNYIEIENDPEIRKIYLGRKR